MSQLLGITRGRLSAGDGLLFPAIDSTLAHDLGVTCGVDMDAANIEVPGEVPKKRWRGRHAVFLLLCGIIAACMFDALVIEPRWLKTTHLRLSDHPTVRIVHISDLHYKGNRAFLQEIVHRVNDLSADAVCFTGDIVENTKYLEEALDVLGGINKPLYGVPGNHEYWSGASFDRISECFEKTGGRWLVDRTTVSRTGQLRIEGRSGRDIDTRRAASEFAMPGRRADWTPAPAQPASAGVIGGTSAATEFVPELLPGGKTLLLAHYPVVADGIKDRRYDLILAGHSHGGQVRLPFIGALIVPYGVNGYQKGLYATAAGPLHVSPGLGTYLIPARFLCRPEITLIEL